MSTVVTTTPPSPPQMALHSQAVTANHAQVGQSSNNSVNSAWIVGNSFITGNVTTTTVSTNAHQVTVCTNPSSTGTNVGTWMNNANLVNNPFMWMDETCTPDDIWIQSHSDAIKSMLTNLGLPLAGGGKLMLKKGVPSIVYNHNDPDETWEPLPLQHRGIIDLKQHVPDLLPGSILRLPSGRIIVLKENGELEEEVFENARKKIINLVGGDNTLHESIAFCQFKEIHIAEGLNTKATFILPNGVRIDLHPDDHIEIDESDGHQLYRSEARKNFNTYLNASDLLEEFIAYCAEQKVTRKDFAELPVSLFIYWLIVRAAESDNDPTDEVLPMLTSAIKIRKQHTHRCKCCGKYLTKTYQDNGISFCSPQHLETFLYKLERDKT